MDVAFYRPLFDPVVDAFGSDRVLFGSNWTLCEMRGAYADMVPMLDAYCGEREDLSREQLFFQNALTAYDIEIAGE